MTDAQVFICIAIILVGALFATDKRKAHIRKNHHPYDDLSFDEKYVIACLLQVSPDTLYGEAIRYNLKKTEGAAALRKLIREVSESYRENPEVMKSILGEEAFQAVAEYTSKLPSEAA